MPDPMQPVVGRLMAQSQEDESRLAEIIQDYNPRLRLRKIPKNQRETDQEKNLPYVICHLPEQGDPEVVFYLSKEQASDPVGVLSRLFESDNTKHGKGGVLRRLEARERAEEVWNAKQAVEVSEARAEFWRQLFKSPKHTWNHHGYKFDTVTHKPV